RQDRTNRSFSTWTTQIVVYGLKVPSCLYEAISISSAAPILSSSLSIHPLMRQPRLLQAQSLPGVRGTGSDSHLASAPSRVDVMERSPTPGVRGPPAPP